MIKSVKAITASSYLSMFFLGVSASLLGAAARNIGLSPSQIGLLIAAQNLGFILSVSVSGALSDTHEKPKILLAGSLILAFSFFTFYLSELFWINLLLIFSIGAGTATYEGVTDAMLLDIHTQRENLHINVNHFFVTLGSTMITLYLIFLQMNWRRSIVQSGIVVLLLAAFFALTKLENKRNRAGRYLERFQILRRERVVVVLFIATALAVGVELGSIGILTTFLMELRGFSQVTSKIGLVLFLTGMATGRLFVGFFTQKEQISQVILGLFGLSSLVFTGLYFLNLAELTYIAIYFAGLTLSALLPLMITLAGLRYKDMAGTVLGIIKVAAGLGGVLIPFFMSLIAKYLSLQVSLLLFPAAFLLAFFMLFLEIRHIKSFEPAPAMEPAN
jgi:predicted MFS family arabinose efflux permease